MILFCKICTYEFIHNIFILISFLVFKTDVCIQFLLQKFKNCKYNTFYSYNANDYVQYVHERTRTLHKDNLSVNKFVNLAPYQGIMLLFPFTIRT